MTITLLQDRVIDGKDFKAGDVVEVHESLASQMILNGIAVFGENPTQKQPAKKAKKSVQRKRQKRS